MLSKRIDYNNLSNLNKYDEVARALQDTIDQLQATGAQRQLSYAEQGQLAELDEKLAEVQSLASAYETSGRAHLDKVMEDFRRGQADNRAAAARRTLRNAQYQAEMAALDDKIGTLVTWDVPVLDIRDQRAIVAPHIAELEKRQQLAAWLSDEAALQEAINAAVLASGGTTPPAGARAALAAKASLAFETHARTEWSRREYVVYSDETGHIFVDGALP